MLFSVAPFFAGLALFVVLRKICRTNERTGHLPPGPPADFIIGHARKLPRESAWKTYAEWGKSYGDVMSAYAFGTTLIVLNSVASAHDILVRRSTIFSDRPWLPVFEMMGWGITIPFLSYGTRLRKQRRMMQKHFNPQAITSFRALQEAEVCKFLGHLLARPANFLDDIHGLITRIILLIAYGHKVTSEEDPLIELVERSSRMSISAGSPGTTIIDIFPFLRHMPAWLPGMQVKRHAQKARKLNDEALNVPYDEVKARKAKGEQDPCLISCLLDEYGEAGVLESEHEEDMKAVGFTVYVAGNDSTKTVISTFFMMMALHPGVIKQAHEEIDRIVGTSRLPTFNDRPDLLYVECILKELYRINPPGPLGVPHTSTKSDTYRGWMIPSGSTILTNIWQMMRDEQFFSEPDVFNPARHVDTSPRNGSLVHNGETPDEYSSANGDDPGAIVFGFGRRLCPGRHFADSIIWLTIVNVLATFDIRPYKDPVSGEDVPPEFAFETGILTPPKAFKCAIVPRSAKHAQVVKGMHV
ncbi:cytochrome P450 [Phellopilus nigrolimitatus]|nr:cytochrome P450 [Phellopilus nigrolimitatus]